MSVAVTLQVSVVGLFLFVCVCFGVVFFSFPKEDSDFMSPMLQEVAFWVNFNYPYPSPSLKRFITSGS